MEIINVYKMSRARAWKQNIWFVYAVMELMETFPYMQYY